jgi:hypothetical protein
MNKKVKLLKTVTLFGSDIAAEEVIEVNEVSAAALVKEGAAEYEEGEAGTQDPGQQQDPNAVDPVAAAAAEVDRQKKALDAQYTKDVLAAAAKEIGVEFPYDATKGAIVEAIVAAGKASALLK